ncbi:hypothetical protein SPD48_18490 [Pseudogracilibacillus sp. SE30717A]|uniref:hypothetical protein n=1 Tax=Pseudogracilibacillus sp. SE30717A TaxID=3098293 RepID=UPI00300DCACE
MQKKLILFCYTLIISISFIACNHKTEDAGIDEQPAKELGEAFIQDLYSIDDPSNALNSPELIQKV